MKQKFERREFNEFWKLYESKSAVDQRMFNYTDGMGYHAYAEVKLNLDLIAAEEPKDALKCVELLEDFTSISVKAAALVNARVLEVQGNTIHFFLPAASILESNLLQLLAFSAALTQTVYNQLKPAAG